MGLFSGIKHAVKKAIRHTADIVFPGAEQGAQAAADSILPKLPEFPELPGVPAPPGTPGEDPAARAARDAAAEELRRRSGRGRQATNPLGGTGDTSAANLATKSLLGE